MLLAKVLGNVVATQKNEHLKGHKLLITRQIDPSGKFVNELDIIALDLVQAGIDDMVLLTQEGDAVAQVLGHRNAPVHTIIVAVVDSLDCVPGAVA